MSVPNNYELLAREKKCRLVVKAILQRAVDVLGAAGDDSWEGLAKDAGVNVPSAESRKRIVQILIDMGELSK